MNFRRIAPRSSMQLVRPMEPPLPAPDDAPPAQLQEWVSSATAHWGPVIRESGYELQ
jgi:hypothetical protein